MSDDTVNNWIADIANDILSQLITQNQNSPCRISLQFDETTDIKSISQLVANVRFVKENAIVDEFLLCQEMKERTRAKDVFDLANAFLRKNPIAWNKVGSVCTDGAPAIIGHRSGFVALIKQDAPHIVSNRCAIHKYSLTCKTFPLELKSVLDSVIKAFHFIRGRAVNSRLFKAFCGDLEKEHQYLLFHTKVRWLSRAKALSRVTKLVTEVAVFLREHGSVEITTLFDDNRFQLKVFYLADIFGLFNELCYSLQGKSKSQIEAAEKVSVFKKKLFLWKKTETRILLCFYCWTVKLVIRKLTNG